MKVKKVVNNVYDIFQGEGWYEHSRVRIQKTGLKKRCINISGIKLNNHQLSDFEKRIS